MRYLVRNQKTPVATQDEIRNRFADWSPQNDGVNPDGAHYFVCMSCAVPVAALVEHALAVCPHCQVWLGLRIPHPGELTIWETAGAVVALDYRTL